MELQWHRPVGAKAESDSGSGSSKNVRDGYRLTFHNFCKHREHIVHQPSLHGESCIVRNIRVQVDGLYVVLRHVALSAIKSIKFCHILLSSGAERMVRDQPK